MAREITLDTETTGFSWKDGERIIEIGAVELENRIPTGNTFHKFVNPQGRQVSEGALKVHGITNDFLKDKPTFSEIADEFLDFIKGAKLIIHNAEFDIGFLNAELMHVKKPEIKADQYFCTLIHARKKFPGAQNNLDALCRRFEIDNSHRTYHGALLDSEILAEVYLELMGGAQVAIDLANENNKSSNKNKNDEDNDIIKISKSAKHDFPYRNFTLNDSEIEKHDKMLETIENSIWSKLA
jgi:DNA polymerase-3 subunit epsilon